MSLSSKGYSLLEMMTTIGLLALTCSLSMTGYQTYTLRESALTKNLNDGTANRLFVKKLTKLFQESIQKPIWLNCQVRSNLRIPLDSTGCPSGTIPQNGPLDGLKGAVLIKKGYHIEPQDITPSYNSDIVMFFLTRDKNADLLSLIIPAKGYEEVLPGESEFSLTVTGSLTKYRAGDTLAIDSLSEVEFVKIESISGNTITLSTLGSYQVGSLAPTNLPIRYLTSEVSLYKTVAMVLGVNRSDSKIELYRIPRSGNYVSLLDLGFEVNEIGLIDSQNSDPISDSASFAPGQTDNFLKISWKRPSIGVKSGTNSLSEAVILL